MSCWLELALKTLSTVVGRLVKDHLRLEAAATWLTGFTTI